MFIVLKHKYILLTFSLSILLLFTTLRIYNLAKTSVYYESDIYNQICKEYSPDEKIAFLTFDDGPSKIITPKVLDVLEKYDINASFFVIGKKVEENPDVLIRIYEEGHFIGNHGYSHDNSKLYRDEASFIDEITKTDEIISNVLGVENFKCKIFRFPNGFSSPIYKKQKNAYVKLLTKLGYKYIDWNSLTNDSLKKLSRNELFQVFKETSKNKNILIILMHDSGDLNKTYDVLEDCITYLLNNEYEFETLEDFVE